MILALSAWLALVSGQSNACNLAPYLPPGSAITVCESGAYVSQWDPGTPTGDQFRAFAGLPDVQVLIWWQGENEARAGIVNVATYLQQLVTLFRIVNRPVLILEIGNAQPEAAVITALHRGLSVHPLIAFIPTADLPHDGIHFTPWGYTLVTERLIACVQTQCWTTQ